ncbi:TetR/AcrR family transcriptional regulator [Ekhidna sp.]|uniref:TetR/AcrR family transcriptional regulator n=1 Tax=Ekhidna sp. TaxID=2608089 RepID=UPI003BA9CA89
MKGDKRNIWIDAAYRRFALHGEAGLTVEAIARDLGKNKSSFYHYFGDLQVLTFEILTQHLQNSNEVGRKIKDAIALDPDVIHIIMDHKIDFLFHKQLKLGDPLVYKEHYEKAYAYVKDPLVAKLSEGLGIKDKQLFSNALVGLVSDNFLLRIQETTLSIQWLRDYLEELQALIKHIK